MASMNKLMAGHVLSSMTDRAEGPRFPGNQAGDIREMAGRKRHPSAAVIDLSRIVADPSQPRKEFDPVELDLLAASIRTRGQLQPIRVRWDEALDAYVVVVGERRFRASKLAGLETIAAIVADGSAAPEDILEDQLVENALRSDLRPIEQANAYRTLMSTRGLTQRELAERLHVSQGSVAKCLLLLSLPDSIQREVESGAIAANTAYQLTKVDDPAEQAAMARQAAAGNLSRDEIETRTASRPSAGKGGSKSKSKKPVLRSIRIPIGKVTIELKKGIPADQVAEALRLALAALDVGASEAA
jgi:ParB family chromosome partitioning protein